MYINSYIVNCRDLNQGFLDNYGDKNLSLFTNSYRVHDFNLNFISKISQFTLAIFASIHAFATHSLRAVDEFSAAIVKFDLAGDSATFGLVHTVSAVIQPIAILILGLSKLIPENEITENIEKCFVRFEEFIFNKRYDDDKRQHDNDYSVTTSPDTFFFSPLQAKIQSPIRGCLAGINEIIRTLFHAAHYSLGYLSQDSVIMEEVVNNMKRSSENSLNAPLAGLVGIFDEEALDMVNIVLVD